MTEHAPPHPAPLGAPVQIAYAVSDTRAAAARWQRELGAGPFVFLDHVELATARVQGRPGVFDHSSAYGWWGEVMVELVHEHSPPLVEPGRLHHLAFMVDDLDDTAEHCARRGWPELLHAETAGGQAFRFHDARHELGHLVELYEPSAPLLGFYDRVRRLAGDPA